MGREHRQRPRKNTPHHVKVLDLHSGRPFGRVVDITADGMMLVTRHSLVVGQRYDFRVVLPVMVRYRTEVDVEAEAVWSKKDDNPDYFRTGFRFVNLPGEDGYLLEDVMHKLNLVG